MIFILEGHMFYFFDKDLQTEVLEENKVSRKIRAYGDSIMAVEVFF